MKTEEAKTKQVEKITKEILDGKKPMLFQPPWAKDGKFDKHGPKGMKGFKHHDKKGCKCKEKGECGCKDGKKAEGCKCKDKEGGCPFHKDGMMPPPPPMPEEI